MNKVHLHCGHFNVPNHMLSHGYEKTYEICVDCHTNSMQVFNEQRGIYRFLDISSEYAVILPEYRYKPVHAEPIPADATVEIKIHLPRFKI